MRRHDNRIFEFANFRLEMNEAVLKRNDKIVPLRPKLFNLLVFLIEHHNSILEKDEISSAVWGGASQGSPDQPTANLTVNISSLRQVLGDDADKPMFIETVGRRGYRFIASVKVIQTEASNQPIEEKPADPRIMRDDKQADRSSRKSTIVVSPRILISSVAVAAFLTIVGFLIVGWQRSPQRPDPKSQRQVVLSPADEEDVKRVVKESQFFETLTVYGNPERFDREQLKKYWLPANQGGKAIAIVEKIVAGLLKKGRHYGSESKNVQFEFRYVRIYSPRDYAEVGTIEKWYVPTYNKDGSRVLDKNVYLGPYTVDYSLGKVNGVWLLEENSTPRPQPSPATAPGQ